MYSMKLFFYSILLGFIFFSCSGAKESLQTNNSQQTLASGKTELKPYADILPSTFVQGDTTLIATQAKYIEGITQFELGNYTEALDLLMAAYIKVPEYGGLNFALADAYLQLDDYENAAFYGFEAVQIEPENRHYRLKLAEIYTRAGNRQGAIEQLQKAAEYNPQNIQVLYLLANTLSSNNKLIEANEVYNKIMSLTGPDMQILYKRFQNFNDVGLRDSALIVLNQMQEEDPNNLATLQTLAQFYMEDGNKEGAKEMLQKAIDLEDSDPQLTISLADLYIRDKEWTKAGAVLDKIVRDSLVTARRKMEVIQYMYQQFSDAPEDVDIKKATETLVESFLEIEAEFPMGYALAADFYTRSEDFDKALSALEKTTKLMPQNDNAWRTRVQLLYQEQRYDDVISVGKEADGIFPNDAFIQFFVGATYFIQNKHDDAENWLSLATQTPSPDALRSTIFGMLGDVFSARDKWKEADRAYERSLELDPDNVNVLNNYAYYLSERDEQLERAKKMSLRAINGDPNNASYLDTVGWVFYKLGDFENAKIYIQKSLDTGEASATVLDHMGDIYLKLNQSKKAKDFWDRALKMDPSKSEIKAKIEQLN